MSQTVADGAHVQNLGKRAGPVDAQAVSRIRGAT